MTVIQVIGTQWGDEGKGKVVDYYAKDAEYVVRYQGGNNAGHTIIVDDQEYKLHVIPSGVIQGKVGVIGNGVVIDPEILTDEITNLKKRNITPKLLISDRAHIIMPYHKQLDGAEERYLGKEKIGTTKRGIGPCYSDKVARFGVRAGDLLSKTYLEERLRQIVPMKEKLYKIYGITEPLDLHSLVETYCSYGQQLKPFITQTHIVLNKALQQQQSILLEGAQGTMLDVDYGTYPYTTSSHVIAGGGSIGTGIGPHHLTKIIGIVKAYTTRVGEGPLPTEQTDKTGQQLQKKGNEFGTTTSRPRRCGWLDLVVVNHACSLSGVTNLAITKLDVLDKFPEINLCTNYELNNTTIDYFPASIADMKQCKPVYQTFPGWNTDLTKASSRDELPENAQKYLKYIEDYLHIPISLISIGPKRAQTIEC